MWEDYVLIIWKIVRLWLFYDYCNAINKKLRVECKSRGKEVKQWRNIFHVKSRENALKVSYEKMNYIFEIIKTEVSLKTEVSFVLYLSTQLKSVIEIMQIIQVVEEKSRMIDMILPIHIECKKLFLKKLSRKKLNNLKSMSSKN